MHIASATFLQPTARLSPATCCLLVTIEVKVMINSERASVPFRRWAVLICAALILTSSGVAQAQSPISGIVVFGTSLSDSGNAFVLLGDQNTPANFDLNPLLIPTAPYAHGGHHFSNGATWIEQYARSIGLGESVRPALGSSNPGATNFAVGAARAYNDGANFNLTRQVDTFLQRSGGVASSDALYVIEMGGNDVRDAFQVYVSGPNGPALAAGIINAALTSIATNVQRLYGAGARNFLVWASPNIALTPAIRSLGPAAGGLAAALTQSFNANLTAVVANLSLLPGTTFKRLDAFALVTAIVNNPPSFGLSNATTACLTPSVAPFICQDVNQFLFWDGIHPTTAGHAILARLTADILQ
jgi:phospholipase/lecithinase/hemolysin